MNLYQRLQPTLSLDNQKVIRSAPGEAQGELGCHPGDRSPPLRSARHFDDWTHLDRCSNKDIDIHIWIDRYIDR